MEFLGAVIAIVFIAVVAYLIFNSKSSSSKDTSPTPAPVDPAPQPSVKVKAAKKLSNAKALATQKLSKADLEKFTKAQLVAQAAEYGVKLKQSSKKADLVKAVSAAIKKK